MDVRSRLLPFLVALLPSALLGCGDLYPGDGQDPDGLGRGAMANDACRDYEGQEPTRRPVRISLQNGEIVVDPDRAKVLRKQGELSWQSDQLDHWVVIFHPDRGAYPLQSGILRGRPQARQARARVNPQLECGTYEYTVVVWDDQQQRLVVRDPPVDIIPNW